MVKVINMTVLNRKLIRYVPKHPKKQERNRIHPIKMRKGSCFVNEANDFEYQTANMKVKCRVPNIP